MATTRWGREGGRLWKNMKKQETSLATAATRKKETDTEKCKDRHMRVIIPTVHPDTSNQSHHLTQVFKAKALYSLTYVDKVSTLSLQHEMNVMVEDKSQLQQENNRLVERLAGVEQQQVFNYNYYYYYYHYYFMAIDYCKVELLMSGWVDYDSL